MRWFAMATVCLAVGISSVAIAGPKSALDGYQFDGVSSDAELKVEGHSRRQWLIAHPVQAKEYWIAWDCKGKLCDSAWNATIRKKAALISRTDQDPKPALSISKPVK